MPNFGEFLKALLRLVSERDNWEPLGAVAGVVVLLGFFFGRVYQHLRSPELAELRKWIARLTAENADLRSKVGALQEQIRKLEVELETLRKLRAALEGDEDDLWKLKPSEYRHSQAMLDRRPLVITVANAKGGVSKTTTVANLAPFFEIECGLRVLVIDFDYQASLTRTYILASGSSLDDHILTEKLLGGEVDGAWVAHYGKEIRVSNRDRTISSKEIRLMTCGQSFDGFENRLTLHWLLGEFQDDVRFRLAELLATREVQDRFDLVLIDAPPRFSTGATNALCASHAVLVPTGLDPLATDAVGNFLARANGLRKLNPELRFAGVIGTLNDRAKLSPIEEQAVEVARAGLVEWKAEGHLFETKIRRSTLLSRAAGRQIAYLQDARIRNLYNQLGEEIVDKLKIKKRNR